MESAENRRGIIKSCNELISNIPNFNRLLNNCGRDCGYHLVISRNYKTFSSPKFDEKNESLIKGDKLSQQL